MNRKSSYLAYQNFMCRTLSAIIGNLGAQWYTGMPSAYYTADPGLIQMWDEYDKNRWVGKFFFEYQI